MFLSQRSFSVSRPCIELNLFSPLFQCGHILIFVWPIWPVWPMSEFDSWVGEKLPFPLLSRSRQCLHFTGASSIFASTPDSCNVINLNFPTRSNNQKFRSKCPHQNEILHAVEVLAKQLQETVYDEQHMHLQTTFEKGHEYKEPLLQNLNSPLGEKLAAKPVEVSELSN